MEKEKIEEINNEEETKQTINNENNKVVNEVSNEDDSKTLDDPVYNKETFKENFEYESESLKTIDDERLSLSKYLKKQKIISWVIAFIGLGVIAFAFLGLPTIGVDADGKQYQWVLPVMIFATVISLGAILIFSLLTKRNTKKKAKHYFDTYYIETSNFVFDKDIYSSFELQKPDKIAKVQFDENYIYKDVAEVGSRGLIDFEYKDRKLMICDCSAQVKDSKRIYPIFVGKYLIGPTNYDGDERIVVYIKGDERAICPTNIEDLDNVYDDDDIVIYTKNKNWKKVINVTATKKIKAIKTGSQLVDVAISIYNNHIYVCMGYDDPVMVLPLEHAFDPSPIKEYKRDLLLVCKVVEYLSR